MGGLRTGHKIRSGENDWNAIDPNIIFDEKGNPWMTFGSLRDGIQLVRLEKDMKTPVSQPQTISRRMKSADTPYLQEKANDNAVEAPFIVHHDGYYYLFVSFDYCCKGLDSTYRTVVGRSKDIAQPYVDKEGEAMTEGEAPLW